ncbi:DGQHR domain-containing protein [Candidatus Methanodesulfokora washburnensis]|uniref:DGQHR domain-containing protein n=1 Tax=Candidatus Methanodesulfokora washburnensis TaxID=2478471 RepID=UPI00138748F3|nr:DGQHR domain-containing protein [Candidatus Methanodesulfokores washburnensis]
MWEIPALRLSQQGRHILSEGPINVSLYLTALPTKDLIDETKTKVDRWTKDNPDGYQRPLTRARKKQIMDYLLKEEGLFPTAVLLNCRGKVEFEEKEKGYGVLKIPKESLPLYIVDGQHRIEGLKYAVSQGHVEFVDYPLPTVIMTHEDKVLEVSLFYKINKRQRGVPTEIAERNLQRILEHPALKRTIEGSPVERKAEIMAGRYLDIVDYLNSEPTSPWYNKIWIPGTERKGKWIKQGVFAKAIGKMISRHSTLMVEPTERIKSFLLEYWKVLKELYPNALGERAEEYVLVRSQGVRAFTYLAGAVYLICRQKGSFSYDTIKSILSKLLEGEDAIDEDSLHYEHGAFPGTNERAVEQYYNELLERISE